MAERAVRSPLEVWLSNTCFGVKTKRGKSKYERHQDSLSLDDLNAYRAIVSGVAVQIHRAGVAEVLLGTAETALPGVQVRLPGCSQAGSAWRVELVAKDNYGKSQLLTRSASAGQGGNLSAAGEQSFRVYLTDSPEISTTLPADRALKESWEKDGLLLEGQFALNLLRFSGAEVKVSYWPDKSNPDDLLQLMAYA